MFNAIVRMHWSSENTDNWHWWNRKEEEKKNWLVNLWKINYCKYRWLKGSEHVHSVKRLFQCSYEPDADLQDIDVTVQSIIKRSMVKNSIILFICLQKDVFRIFIPFQKYQRTLLTLNIPLAQNINYIRRLVMSLFYFVMCRLLFTLPQINQVQIHQIQNITISICKPPNFNSMKNHIKKEALN